MSQLPLHERINRRRRSLGLTTAELAGAAGLHPATVHRLIGGTTAAPRPTTLRKLARALAIPLEELTDQIEIEALSESYEPGHPLEDLLVDQLRDIPASLRYSAAVAAVRAMVDVEMGTGRPAVESAEAALDAGTRPPSPSQGESIVRAEFRRIPRLLQRAAAREAIRAMVAVELRRGRPPSKALYQRFGHRQIRVAPTRRRNLSANRSDEE